MCRAEAKYVIPRRIEGKYIVKDLLLCEKHAREVRRVHATLGLKYPILIPLRYVSHML